MGHRLRSDRRGLRRAIAASVVLHLLVALAAFLAMRLAPRPAPRATAVHTRADEVGVKLIADVELAPVPVPVAVEQPKTPPTPTPPVEPPTAPPDPPAPAPTPRQEPAPGRTPHATAVPPALPADVLNRIRRPATTAMRPPNPDADPNVKPAAAVGAPAAVPPIHGALRRDQTVVYVLDCSGSMGEFGKLAVARAALVATLRGQPGEVRFQVIAYGAAARPLLTGGCVPATAANVAAAEAALAPLAAAGKSNHAEAVRRAAALRPDVIVLLTDANELSRAALKPALAAAGKPVVVCVATVAGDRVGEPRELK